MEKHGRAVRHWKIWLPALFALWIPACSLTSVHQHFLICSPQVLVRLQWDPMRKSPSTSIHDTFQSASLSHKQVKDDCLQQLTSRELTVNLIGSAPAAPTTLAPRNPKKNNFRTERVTDNQRAASFLSLRRQLGSSAHLELLRISWKPV